MEFEHLNYQLSEEGILTITLNRPEVFNAINNKISYELQEAFKQAHRDDAVRVVILTANGKAFCSGQDLKEIAGSENRSLSDSLHKRYNPIIRAMRNLPKPIIGAVNGVAAGAGASLALACDMIIAVEEANFIEIFINVGLVPDSGSSYFVPRAVGLAKAFELCTLGSKVSASEAKAMGLINDCVPAEQLMEKVHQLANKYAVAPTASIGLIKKMLQKALVNTLDEQLELEAQYQEIAGRSEDYKEGIAAFNQKRKPVFKGK